MNDNLYDLSDIASVLFKSLNFHRNIFEESMSDLKNNTDVKRKERAKKQPIYCYFRKVNKAGMITFDVTSGTVAGKRYKVNIFIKNIKTLATKLSNDIQNNKKPKLKARDELLKSMLGDITVYCSCPDFHYRWKYVAYKFKFGSVKELRFPKIRNPQQKKCVCKHIIAAFSVLRSNWSTILKALKSKGVLPK